MINHDVPCYPILMVKRQRMLPTIYGVGLWCHDQVLYFSSPSNELDLLRTPQLIYRGLWHTHFVLFSHTLPRKKQVYINPLLGSSSTYDHR